MKIWLNMLRNVEADSNILKILYDSLVLTNRTIEEAREI